jgi:hypothetical protein
MRFIPFILFIFLIAGCSSGGGIISPENDTPARVGLSASYNEDGDSFVDVNIDGAAALYQFSMRLEFDPNCIELIGFEPSRDFGQEPIMVCERLRQIPSELIGDMMKPSNGLIAIAVSRQNPSLGDIERPHFLGRLRFRNKCGEETRPFRIFNRDDYLVFRDHARNRLRIRLHEDEENSRGRG